MFIAWIVVSKRCVKIQVFVVAGGGGVTRLSYFLSESQVYIFFLGTKGPEIFSKPKRGQFF